MIASSQDPIDLIARTVPDEAKLLALGMREDWQGWTTNKSGEMDQLRALAKGAINVAEVGVWKGATTREIAPVIDQLIGSYIAIDTWLGSAEFITRPDTERYHGGGLRGLAQFIANMYSLDLSDRVRPFWVDSATAAECLRQWGVQFDLVYLDAGHSFTSLTRDIDDWWPLVRKGGVLAGDDYSEWWPDVPKAVEHRFGGLMYETRGKLWWARKL